MHPVLFELPGGFPIRSFSVMLALGFLLGVQVWPALLRRYGADRENDPDRSAAVTVAILIGVIGGARLMYVCVELLKYWTSGDPASAGARLAEDWLRVFYLWEGGLAMYGGLFGAVALGLASARKHGLEPRSALDTGLVAGFFGQAVGRVGCLLVGDDHGRLATGWFADRVVHPITLRVPDAEFLRANPESLFDPALAGQVVWSTQLWMSLAALSIATLGLVLLPRRRFAGQVSLWIVLVYGVTRSVIEHFRGDSVRGLWFGGALSTSQIVSIPAVLLAAWLLYRFRSRREPGLGDRPSEPSGSTGSRGAAGAKGS